jgi:hypothetical protein
MSTALIDFTLSRAGWGSGHALDLDVATIEPVRDPETLPNLLRVEATPRLTDILSWPDRSGCALQCQYALRSVDGNDPDRLMTAEAARRGSPGTTCEIELVEGWPGEPHYWGDRLVQEEEIEAAVHGMAPDGDLQLLHVPEEQDTRNTPRARILKSATDRAVLFIAHSPEESQVLSGVVERLCDTGMVMPLPGKGDTREGSRMACMRYQRTRREAPRVTRWLGGHGTRSQQAAERRARVPWPTPQRWRE